MSRLNLVQLQKSSAFHNMNRDFHDLVDQLRTSMHEDTAETQKLIRGTNTDEKQRRMTERLLDSLSFSTMNARQEEVRDAYPDTFKWIFKEKPFATAQWTNFVEWLKTDQDIYWVNGKAGSGKSTVCHHLGHTSWSCL